MEASWAKALDEAESQGLDREPAGDLREQLFNLLNWLDWVGWLIEADVLARPQVVLSSIAPQLRRALAILTPIMLADQRRHEPGYWHGVTALKYAIAISTPPASGISRTRLRSAAFALRRKQAEARLTKCQRWLLLPAA